MVKGSEELICRGQIKEHMFSLAQLWGDHQIVERDLKDTLNKKGSEGGEGSGTAS